MKKLIPLILLLSFSIKAQDVKIGKQIWTSANLDLVTYSNGDAIPQVQEIMAWNKLTTGAWCYYDNQKANGSTYGTLYNWWAVNDPRGLAPKDYHIPTEEEWKILTNYLGGEAGTKMKSTSGWKENGNGTNSSGFAALPGGYRHDNGAGYNIGALGSWWSSTNANSSDAINFILEDDDAESYKNKRFGLSVRCVRD